MRVSIASALLAGCLLAGLGGACRAAAAGEDSFPTFGVAMTGPTGWVRLPEGGPGHIVRWGKVDEKSGKVLAMVMAEVEPAGGRQADAFAADLAKKMGARVLPGASALGMARAIHVEAARGGKDFHPGEGFVAAQGKYLYVLSSFEVEGEDAHAQLDAVRRSWRWIAIEPATAHLAMREEPIPVLDQFLMTIPAIMRPFPVPEKERETAMQIGLFDYQRGAGEFFCHITLSKGAGGMTFAQVQQQFSKSLQEKLGLAAAPAWTALRGLPPRVISGTFDSPRGKGSDKSPPSLVRYCLVDLGGGQTAIVTFTFMTREQPDLKAYLGSSDAMVRSIAELKEEPAPPQQPPPKPDDGWKGRRDNSGGAGPRIQ